MEKYEFIRMMLKSRNLSINDKRRLVLLATQEIEKNEDVTKDGEANAFEGGFSGNEQVHAPKDTAAFLSLFEREDGFKFLTHDFDPNSELEYDQLVKLACDAFTRATRKYTIPRSLYALMHTMLFGGKAWIDGNGKRQAENFTCDHWLQWAKENPKCHVLSNKSIQNVLWAFRSTTRLVCSGSDADSRLETIVKRLAEKHTKLTIIPENLEDADFYTNVYCLGRGISLILDDMSKYPKDVSKIKISFESSNSGDFKLCVIRITQFGSCSSKSLAEVQRKFNGGGGDFYSIKKTLSGYCNWSVESIWGDGIKRWNILDDTGKKNEENISSSDILGFTHILTYYKKLK